MLAYAVPFCRLWACAVVSSCQHCPDPETPAYHSSSIILHNLESIDLFQRQVLITKVCTSVHNCTLDYNNYVTVFTLVIARRVNKSLRSNYGSRNGIMTFEIIPSLTHQGSWAHHSSNPTRKTFCVYVAVILKCTKEKTNLFIIFVLHFTAKRFWTSPQSTQSSKFATQESKSTYHKINRERSSSSEELLSLENRTKTTRS